MNRYSILLDKVYELEGLLHLAVNRDNPPATLDSLIRRKAGEITSEIAALPIVESETSETQATEENAGDAYSRTDDYVADDYNMPDEHVEANESDETDETDMSDIGDVPDSADDDEGADENEDIYDEDESYEEDDEPESDAGYTDDDVEDEELPAPKKFAFSINDRFRFRRTLFDNSDRKFNVAVASISACHSYEEAEQMLMEDYGWNPEDIEVADFMRLVSNYFKYKR